MNLRAGAGYRLRACIYILIICLPAVTGAEVSRPPGLLWEITGPGMKASYLFGTVHSEDPEVLQLPPPVRRAFDAAGSVVLEVRMDTDAIIQSGAAMLLTDGRTLPELVGRPLFEQTVRAMQPRGIPEDVLARMKPWAAATTLSLPPPETGEVLDMLLARQAGEAGKPLYGLETIREQLDIFDTMPEPDQVLMLRDVVENLAVIERMNRELLEAYKRRDLAGLQALSEQYMQAGDFKVSSELEQRLIVDRNRVMVERMQPYLDAGPVFIAVGALHLPGDEGMLNLLERRGYTLKVLY